MKKYKRPEILAPAGNMEAYEAAKSGGCDAVYLGGAHFGARAYADNFSFENLKAIVKDAHENDLSIYYTLNTLVKDVEWDSLEKDIESLLDCQIDALIIQDMGIYEWMRKKEIPIAIHASTQMNLHSVEDLQIAKDLGFERVVLSRECSLKDIHKIREKVDIELEAFVHGALCYCYSGQCLMSSVYGGRSGNRGRCAQPCRMIYDVDGTKAYFLSPKDQMTLSILPDLIEAGVDSLKIEGRMKRPEYVYMVTWMYHKYVDLAMECLEKGKKESYHVDEEDVLKLKALFNRGGFTDGYYKKHNDPSMITTRHAKHQGVHIGTIQVLDKGYQLDLEAQVKNGDVLEVNFPLQDVSKSVTTFSIDLPMQIGLQKIVSSKSIKGMRRQKDRIDKLNLPKKGRFPLYRIHDEALDKEIRQEIKEKEALASKESLTVFAECFAYVDQRLRLYCSVTKDSKTYDVFMEGNQIEPASSRPITSKDIYKHLNKIQDTPFEFEPLIIHTDEKGFVPVSWIKTLRRQVLSQLEEKLEEKLSEDINAQKNNLLGHRPFLQRRDMNKFPDTYQREIKGEYPPRKDIESKHSILVSSQEQLINLYEWLEKIDVRPPFERLYLEIQDLERGFLPDFLSRLKKQAKIQEVFLALPHVLFYDYRDRLEKRLDSLDDSLFDGFLIRSLGQVRIAKNYKKSFVTDTNMHSFNKEAVSFYENLGAEQIGLSLELNHAGIRDILKSSEKAELMVFGKIGLMHASNCIYKTSHGCKYQEKGNLMTMTDRKNETQEVRTHCQFCYNTIYNAKPMDLTEDLSMKKDESYSIRVQFTTETAFEMGDILDRWTRDSYPLTENDKTKGHFQRGVK